MSDSHSPEVLLSIITAPLDSASKTAAPFSATLGASQPVGAAAAVAAVPVGPGTLASSQAGFFIPPARAAPVQTDPCAAGLDSGCSVAGGFGLTSPLIADPTFDAVVVRATPDTVPRGSHWTTNDNSTNILPTPSPTASAPETSIANPRPAATSQKMPGGIKWSIDSILSSTPTPIVFPEPCLKVLSGDNKEFIASERVIQQSKVLENLSLFLKNCGVDPAHFPPIPLLNIDGRTMALIWEWADKRYNKANSGDSKAMSAVEENLWNDMEVGQVYKLMCAGESLDIASLARFARERLTAIANGRMIITPKQVMPITTPTTLSPVSMPLSAQNAAHTSQSAPTTPNSRECSRCGVGKSCRWRNVMSSEILCNACFTYRRKYNKDRPASAAVAYHARASKMNNTM